MALETVQALASSLQPNDPIPSEFVQNENEQPGAATSRGPDRRARVPIIDLGSGTDSARVTEAIVAASQEWGIFQVVNHGIPADVVAKLQSVGREFFELPPEEKEVPSFDPKSSGTTQGYGTQLIRDVNRKVTWGDFLFHYVWPPSCVDYAYWPKKPSSYRQANEEYTKHLIGVMEKVLENLSLGLGLEGSTLKNALGGEDLLLLLKIYYYPPCPRPDLALGVLAHTDISSITILLPNDVPGLQVSRDDLWFDVDYVPGALIVNIGDQIQILSNGKYKSALHRAAVNNEKVRFSWPVFFEPPPQTMVGPLPQLVTDQNPAKYTTKMYKDYRYCKSVPLPPRTVISFL